MTEKRDKKEKEQPIGPRSWWLIQNHRLPLCLSRALSTPPSGGATLHVSATRFLTTRVRSAFTGSSASVIIRSKAKRPEREREIEKRETFTCSFKHSRFKAVIVNDILTAGCSSSTEFNSYGCIMFMRLFIRTERRHEINK